MKLLKTLKMRLYRIFPIVVILVILSLAACNQSPTEESTNVAETAQPEEVDATEQPPSSQENNSEPGYPAPNSEGEQGYPGPTTSENGSGYPADSPPYEREGVSEEPPNPARELPEAGPEAATVGGVLIEEITDQGFVPLMPVSLSLATVVETTDGKPAFLSTGSADPKAQLFPTGIFIFQNIPPGSYGLVVDVGFTTFPVKTLEGEIFMFEVEAGEVLDLGQVITPLPNSTG